MTLTGLIELFLLGIWFITCTIYGVAGTRKQRIISTILQPVGLLAIIWIFYVSTPHARKSFWNLYDESSSIRIHGGYR